MSGAVAETVRDMRASPDDDENVDAFNLGLIASPLSAVAAGDLSGPNPASALDGRISGMMAAQTLGLAAAAHRGIWYDLS